MSASDVAVVLAVVVVIGALVWALSARAGRLDRMHVRVETTRAALDAALLRRAAAAEALATSGALDPASALLLAGAAAEATAPPSSPLPSSIDGVEREVAESDLSRVLRAVLDPAAVQALHASGGPVVEELLADLATASERVVLARRFSNDAVVAARRVRRGAVVRLAHLAGRAPMPRTFDVDDEPPALAPRAPAQDGAFESEWVRGDDGLWFRRGARVLVVDPDGPGGPALLLVRGHDRDQVDRLWWFTVGGGIVPGEDPSAAAVRELAEETGIVVDVADLAGPVFARSAVFDFLARTCRQDEVFFLTSVPGARGRGLSTSGWTEVEDDVLDELRWWSLPDLAALEASGVEVYPRCLAALVEPLLGGWDGVLREIGD